MSLPASLERARQNSISVFIFAISKFCLSCLVPSFPRLSKSKNRMTLDVFDFSSSDTTSRNDLPPVFTDSSGPSIPKARRASMSFFPSTRMRVPLADSSASALKTSAIFSSFSRSRFSNGVYLVTLRFWTTSMHSLAALSFSK
jgi:hypothetical protein